jgi:hypothetical protein
MWPPWWDWEFELSAHLLKRKVDRSFNEVDVRRMLSAAYAFRRDVVPGRWLVQTRHRRSRWEIVVEPDVQSQIVLVISAYPVSA